MTFDDLITWSTFLIVPLFILAFSISIIEWMWKTAIKDLKKTFSKKKKVDKL